jgi:hypothetical protein
MRILSRLLTEQPQGGVARRREVPDRPFDAQFDFRSISHAAPDGQLGSDLFSPLAHPRQTVMTGPALFYDFRGDTLPVIPDSQPEAANSSTS